jgi:hypothetical protein
MRLHTEQNQNRRCPGKSEESKITFDHFEYRVQAAGRGVAWLRSIREPSPRRAAEFKIELQPAMQVGYSRQEFLHTSETLEVVLDFLQVTSVRIEKSVDPSNE